MRASRGPTGCNTPRERGFALVATLLLLTLLIAVAVQLATVASVESVSSARRHRTLIHELAVDSAVVLLSERLSTANDESQRWVRDLDQFGFTLTNFAVGPATVQCVLRDDAAKFNPILFQRADQQNVLTRKLALLAERKALPVARVALQPLIVDPSQGGARYRWYDQLLAGVEPGTFFRWPENPTEHNSSPVWSDGVTFWGDGRVDLRRADENVLEAALEDIRPGLAKVLLSARPTDRSVNFLQTALVGVPAEIRTAVANRITFDARRYAVRMETAVEADRRQWYVVLQVDADSCNVLHRSQLTW
jgi:type II secretory pathway component PulK